MSCSNKVWILAALSLWRIDAAPVQFRTHDLPRAVFGASYRAAIATQVDGRCPESDTTLEMAGGRLPRGIELAGEALAGVPKEFGVFHLRLRAVNGCGQAIQELALEVTGKPMLRVTPDRMEIEYREGDPLPRPEVIFVSGSWDELPYSVQTMPAPWLHFRANQGLTPYPGSAYAADAVTIQAMPDGLAPGIYHAVMSFSTEQGANLPEVPITLRVLPKK